MPRFYVTAVVLTSLYLWFVGVLDIGFGTEARPREGMKSAATGNAEPIQNRRADLLDDERSHFRRGNNYGVKCVRTPRQRPHLDSRRGRSEPYSRRAFYLVDRTASASTL